MQRGQPLEADVQLRNITVAAQAIAEVAKENRVVVTHATVMDHKLDCWRCNPPLTKSSLFAEQMFPTIPQGANL